MKYKVMLKLILNSDKEILAYKIYEALLSSLKDHAQVINKGLATEERSYLKLEECRHDEGKPCTTLRSVTS